MAIRSKKERREEAARTVDECLVSILGGRNTRPSPENRAYVRRHMKIPPISNRPKERWPDETRG